MRNVKKTDFINNIDEYLNEAAEGKEVVIRQRNKVIARLVPPESPDEEEARLQRLVAEGKIIPPKRRGGIPESFWKRPAPEISMEKILAAVRAERDED